MKESQRQFLITEAKRARAGHASEELWALAKALGSEFTSFFFIGPS